MAHYEVKVIRSIRNNDLVVKRLLRTDLFLGTTELDRSSNNYKIFLTVIGEKPVSSVYAKWQHAGGKSSVDAQVSTFLRDLGLRVLLEHPFEGVTVAVIALSPDNLESYGKATTSTELGRLFGYPETAVRAFDTDECMSLQRQELIEQSHGILPELAMFRLSKNHWRDELDVIKRWQTRLKDSGLIVATTRSAA